jgi:RNA-directed DNA polymerase
LEGTLAIVVANAQHVKKVPGCKTDVKDAEWLADLLCHGLLRRPGRSAKQAIAITRKRCWQYDWVVEFDIKAAFDQIDHGLLLKAVRTHIREGWILLYVERWLTAPFEFAEGEQLQRERGTPQGGVASPILMNLFMHYAFDTWMKRNNPQCPFARYADDAVVHCRTQEQAKEVMQSIALRLAECGLTMHPEKSKIVYCKDSNRTKPYPHVNFTFLGFTFRPRKALSKHRRAIRLIADRRSDPGVRTSGPGLHPSALPLQGSY